MSLKDFHKQDLEETLTAFEKLQKRISKFWFPYIGRGTWPNTNMRLSELPQR